jgi:hypothetical protein
MLERIVRGEVARKHHVALRDEEGRLRHEECLTRAGFDGPYTIAYHVHRPHAQHVVEPRHGWRVPAAAPPRGMAKRHYRTQALTGTGGPPVDARTPLLFNPDVVIGLSTPTAEDPVYFSDGDADELVYVFQGGGILRSALGDLRFEASIRRADDSNVDRDRLRASHALHLLLLEHAKQLGLQIEGELTDLVEEEGSSVRELESARPALRSTRECTLLVSEELTLDQGGGDRRATDLDERPPSPRA